MPDKKIQLLYEDVKKNYEVGTISDFETYLADPVKREQFFNEVVKPNYEVKSLDEFESIYGLKKKDNTLQSSSTGAAVSVSETPSTSQENEIPVLNFNRLTLGKEIGDAYVRNEESKKPNPSFAAKYDPFVKRANIIKEVSADPTYNTLTTDEKNTLINQKLVEGGALSPEKLAELESKKLDREKYIEEEAAKDLGTSIADFENANKKTVFYDGRNYENTKVYHMNDTDYAVLPDQTKVKYEGKNWVSVNVGEADQLDDIKSTSQQSFFNTPQNITKNLFNTEQDKDYVYDVNKYLYNLKDSDPDQYNYIARQVLGSRGQDMFTSEADRQTVKQTSNIQKIKQSLIYNSQDYKIGDKGDNLNTLAKRVGDETISAYLALKNQANREGISPEDKANTEAYINQNYSPAQIADIEKIVDYSKQIREAQDKINLANETVIKDAYKEDVAQQAYNASAQQNKLLYSAEDALKGVWNVALQGANGILQLPKKFDQDSDYGLLDLWSDSFNQSAANLTPLTAERKLYDSETGIDASAILPLIANGLTSMYLLGKGGNALSKAGTGYNTGVLVSSFAMSHNNYYQQAQGKMSDEQANKFSIAAAGLTSMLELISPGERIWGDGGLAKISLNEAMTRFAKGETMESILKPLGTEILNENIQELSQDLGDKFISGVANTVIGKDALDTSYNLNDFLETVVATTFATGLAGGFRGVQSRGDNREEIINRLASNNSILDIALSAIQNNVDAGIVSPEKANQLTEELTKRNAEFNEMPEDWNDNKKAYIANVKKQLTPFEKAQYEVGKDGAVIQKELSDSEKEALKAINDKITNLSTMSNTWFDNDKKTKEERAQSLLKNDAAPVQAILEGVGENKTPETAAIEINDLKEEADKLKQEKDFTIEEMLDRPLIYDGQNGTIYQDGQTLVFKVAGQPKEIELGNFDEIKEKPISDFGLTNEVSEVSFNDNGELTVRDIPLVNNYSDPLSAINYDAEGKVLSVNLETKEGKKRTFRGNIAEDIAYQLHLQSTNKNEVKPEVIDFTGKDNNFLANKEPDFFSPDERARYNELMKTSATEGEAAQMITDKKEELKNKVNSPTPPVLIPEIEAEENKKELPSSDELKKEGIQIESTLEAEQLHSEGYRIFGFSEQDEEPVEIGDISELDNFTPDQLIYLPIKPINNEQRKEKTEDQGGQNVLTPEDKVGTENKVPTKFSSKELSEKGRREIMENLSENIPELKELMDEGMDILNQLEDIDKKGGGKMFGGFNNFMPSANKLYSVFLFQKESTPEKKEREIAAFKSNLEKAKEYLKNTPTDEVLSARKKQLEKNKEAKAVKSKLQEIFIDNKISRDKELKEFVEDLLYDKKEITKENIIEAIQAEIKTVNEIPVTKKYTAELKATELDVLNSLLEKVSKAELVSLQESKTQEEKVKEVLKTGEKSIKEIAELTGIVEPNIRRILGVGAKSGKFERVDKGVYVLKTEDNKQIAWIEAGDAKEVLGRMADEGKQFDMVFLDPAYFSKALIGGNRGIKKYEFISPDDFGDVMKNVYRLVDNDNHVYVMLSGAKSAQDDMAKYVDGVVNTGFKLVGEGGFTKTFKDGSPVTNVMGKVAAPERLILFTKSGEAKPGEIPISLNFRFIRPSIKTSYSTEKPKELLRALIMQSTFEGDEILDSFGGSGVTGEQAIETGRKPTIVEKDENVVENIIKPRMENAIPKEEEFIEDEEEQLPLEALDYGFEELTEAEKEELPPWNNGKLIAGDDFRLQDLGLNVGDKVVNSYDGQVYTINKELGKEKHSNFIEYALQSSDGSLTKDSERPIYQKVTQAKDVEAKVEKGSTEVFRKPLSEITTNEALYQGRLGEKYAEESVRSMLNEFGKKPFDAIWIDPEGNVLSGHSRRFAFIILNKIAQGKKLTEEERNLMPTDGRTDQMVLKDAINGGFKADGAIDVRVKEGTPEELQDFARRSNKAAMQESPASAARRYRELREKGVPRSKILEEARKDDKQNGKNYVSLSYLNPDGLAIKAIIELDKGEGESRGMALQIATKVGRIREFNDFLTDAHEAELFKHFLEQKEVPTDKEITDQNSFLNRSINAVRLTPNEPLNLKRLVQKSPERIEWEKERDELEDEISDLKKMVNPDKVTGWNGLKNRIIANLAKNKSPEAIAEAEKDFNDNKDAIKDRYQEILDQKKAELKAASDRLARHLLQENNLIQGEKQQMGLFGEPVMVYEAPNQPGKQLSLFYSSSVEGDYEVPNDVPEINDDDKYKTTVRGVWQESNYVPFNGTVNVQSHKDVAEIMKLLESKQVEHFFAVYVDPEGNSHIHHVSMGGTSGVTVDAKIIFAGINRFKAKKVYLVHNHPSGNLEPSPQDVSITQNIGKVLTRMGVDMEHLIMDTYKGEYTLLDKYGDKEQYDRVKDSKDNKPLPVHTFDMMEVLSEPLARVTKVKDLAEIIQQFKFSALPKRAMLVLSRNLNVLANIKLESYSITDIVREFANIPGSSRVILYGNVDELDEINKLVAPLKKVGMEILDFVQLNSSNDIEEAYVSNADIGLLGEVQTEYGTNSVKEPGQLEYELNNNIEKLKKEISLLNKQYDKSKVELSNKAAKVSKVDLFGSKNESKLFDDQVSLNSAERIARTKLDEIKGEINKKQAELTRLENSRATVIEADNSQLSMFNEPTPKLSLRELRALRNAPATDNTDDETKSVGITHAATGAKREDLEFDQYEKQVITDAEMKAGAIEAIKNGYNIKDMISRLRQGIAVSEFGGVSETAILAEIIPVLDKKASENPTDENLRELEEALEAAEIAGTVGGREQRYRRFLQPVEPTLANYLIEEKRTEKTDTLTEAQKDAVKQEFEALEKSRQDWENKYNELVEENKRKEALKEVRTEGARKPKSKKSHDEYVSERDKIKQKIAEKWNEAGKGNNMLTSVIVPLPFTKIKQLIAVAPDVKDLMRSLVEEGIDKLDSIINTTHDILKDEIDGLTKNDIRDIIAGEYNEPKKTKRELFTKLFDLKTEAKLRKLLEDLENGEIPKAEKKQLERNQEITRLRKRIKDLKNGFGTENLSPQDPKLKAIKTRLNNQIKDVEKQIASGDYVISKEVEPIKLDKEATDLKDRYIKLKNERQKRILQREFANRSRTDRYLGYGAELVNVPRTLMSSLDFSAVLRQGLIPTILHPRMAMKAFGTMIAHAKSQKKFDRWFFDLQETPAYAVMQQSNLYVADPHDVRLTVKEEQFMNNLAEKVPIVGETLKIGKVTIPGLGLIKGSERAYVSYLNKLRVDLFLQGAKLLEDQGKTFNNSPELYKGLASFVNNATGRGELHGWIKKSAPFLNAAYFAPRFIAARLNMLGLADLLPFGEGFYRNLPAEIRNQAIVDMLRFISFGFLVLELIKIANGCPDDCKNCKNCVTVESDPRSSDFGKVKDGNTRYDIWGGFLPYVHLIAQIATGEKKQPKTGKIQELNGKKAFGETKTKVIGRFNRGKLAPIPSTIYDLVDGRTIIGDPVTLQGELESRLTPLFYQDVKKAMEDKGIKALFTVGLPGAFGVGVQTYEEKKKK